MVKAVFGLYRLLVLMMPLIPALNGGEIPPFCGVIRGPATVFFDPERRQYTKKVDRTLAPADFDPAVVGAAYAAARGSRHLVQIAKAPRTTAGAFTVTTEDAGQAMDLSSATEVRVWFGATCPGRKKAR